MRKRLFPIIPSILVVVIFAAAIALLVVKLLWAWTVPDLFPGAVKQGLIAARISWLAAFKIVLFLVILGGSLNMRSDSRR